MVRLHPSSTVSPGARAGADAFAIVVFVTIGLLSHHGGVSLRGYARDLLPFLGLWFAAAAAFGLYSEAGCRRLVATWAIGVPAAVLVRALVLGHSLNGKEAAFLGVSLVTIAVLVSLTRLCLRVLPSAPSSRRSGRTPSPPAAS
jgi:hypothetical protein